MRLTIDYHAGEHLRDIIARVRRLLVNRALKMRGENVVLAAEDLGITRSSIYKILGRP